MSFFKRLKDKFTTSTENQKTEELEQEQQSELDVEQSQTSEEPQEKVKQPKKLKEADFDDDGLISIEDFEELKHSN